MTRLNIDDFINALSTCDPLAISSPPAHSTFNLHVSAPSKRKPSLKELRQQRDILEDKVKRRLCGLKPSGVIEGSRADVVRRITFESELLSRDNLKLRHELSMYRHSFALADQAFTNGKARTYCQLVPQTILEASQHYPWVEAGWRVHFPNGEPSFYFYPFSNQEVNEAVKYWESISLTNSITERIGSVLGWKVFGASLAPSQFGDSFLAHRKFTTRVNCSIQEADTKLKTFDINARPLVVIPPNWHDSKRRTVTTQVLQQCEIDAFVMVTNIPGDVHFRYFHIDLRQAETNENGKRVIRYGGILCDTRANARHRSVEQPLEPVNWANQGGVRLEFTEVDEKTIDVVYHRWSRCENEDQAEQLFIQWAQIASRWAQVFHSPMLLAC
ncbi:hypothetical protein P3T76_005684 [Phytophthora citrophthora]|uniref:Uncharacterized protein n=1 Tax=Phytophthora citrophthora TaxID=4793 RepID=A0AAD9GQT6_9STRA|nr:hypothetical protein P3T76_005684 [Phytophthora citrophthora]